MMTSNIRTKTPYLRLPKSKTPEQALNRENRAPVPKEVGGIIQGKKAYSTEVAWAKGLERANKRYIFQFEVPTAYTLPGRGKNIDFLVDGLWADEIDGEIAHKTESQKMQDAERDMLLSEPLHELGINDIRRIDAALFTNKQRIDDLIRKYYL